MRPDTRGIVRLATAFYLAVALFSVAWAWIFGHSLLGEHAPSGDALAQGLLLGLGIVAGWQLAYRWFDGVERASRFIGEVLGPVSVPQAAWLALLSGFVEEICFRGALWPHLGLVGSSVFFGLCHIVPARALIWYPLFAAGAGFLFGLLREHSGSVWPPVVAHVTVNGINLAWIGRLEEGRRDPVPAPPPAAPAPPPVDEDDVVLPADLKVEDTFPMTIWRYDLRVELTGTDRETLPDCLEHENLEIFGYVPRPLVQEELKGGMFVFAESFSDPLTGFGHDCAAISAYLFEPVIGLEVAERHTDEKTTDDVRAWKVVAQRGEWVKVPLVIPPPENGRFVVDPECEDQKVLEAHWNEYPRWFQDGMRFKYPGLRDL